MSSKKTRSLQEIIRSRQRETFVGREEQLAFLRNNLGWEPDDSQRRFVINVSGQGGVGKTWLLQQFCKLAEERGAITAHTDETLEDVPSVMGRIAEHFEKQGHVLKAFAKRYKVYRQKRQELEDDPEAPQGFSAILGKTIVKGGLRLARCVPVGSIVADFVDEDAVSGLGGDFAAYIARKITNKDEVHLVLDPVKVLTPLFLAGLAEVAEKHSLVLFFDTYEHTGDFLDPWLRDLLKGRYGDVPANILLVIAGRDGLDGNYWSPYEGVLICFPLDPFTDEESRDYLARKGVTDEQVIDVILSLSGRLPLLVAMLAAESPDDPKKIGDPSGEAVERFLSWVEDPERRRIALDAALPRRLNQDMLAVVTDEEKAQQFFTWLKGMPFVEKRDDGWAYHDVVRQQMLRYKRQESPQGWADLHDKLAKHYSGLRDCLGQVKKTRRKDEIWQRYALESLYHSVCSMPQTQLTSAIEGFLLALDAPYEFAWRWAKVLVQAGKDAGVADFGRWGERLVQGLQDYEEDHYDKAKAAFAELIVHFDLAEKPKAIAFAFQGEIYRLMQQYNEAQADFDRAIELLPDYVRAITLLGETYRLKGDFKKALGNFDRAIELNPNYVWAIASRGFIHHLMDDYRRALKDFNFVIKLNPKYEWAIAHRGITHSKLQQHDEALRDFNSVLQLSPHNAQYLTNRAQIYLHKKFFEQALSDLNHAIESNPNYAKAFTVRAKVRWAMNLYEEVDTDFEEAIRLDPRYANSFVKHLKKRANRHEWKGRYLEALADLDRAIELSPDDAKIVSSRGQINYKLGQYNEALSDFARAIELRPDQVWNIAGRGETYRQMKRYEDALADFEHAIELKPENHWCFYNRALVYRLLNRADEAQSDIIIAIRYAQEAYCKKPRNWRNTLRLALYNLVAGEENMANDLYQEVLSILPPSYLGLVSIGISDLDDFLKCFPDNAHVQEIRDRLQKHLDSVTQARKANT